MKAICLAVILFLPALLFGAASTPVTISSITVSSGVATVTTSAVHNIPASNPGFCIKGVVAQTVDNVCGTAATVPTTTTFTFNAPAGVTLVACASSCGTAQPAKNFLIAGNPITNLLGLQNVTVCVWNYIQTPLPVPNENSSCSSAETDATLLSEENGALASGSWFETTLTLTFASSDTRAQIEQEMQRIQFAMQLAIASGIQPGRDRGTFCDAVGCNQ